MRDGGCDPFGDALAGEAAEAGAELVEDVQGFPGDAARRSCLTAVADLSPQLSPRDNAPVVALGLLGPLELRRPDGSLVRIGSGRQRRLLSALAMHPNTAVDADLLVELVWGDELLADPAGALQTTVARLRRLLPPEVRIVTADRSYRLVLDPGELDVARFSGAAEAAGRDGGGDELAAALALWRGRPYLELDNPSVAPEVTRLVELRGSAIEQRGQALLDSGRAGEAVVVLEWLVGDEPLRERAVGLLARALVAAGRQSDALAVLARLRRALAAQLGLDPSPELRRLEQRVLRQEIGPPSRGLRPPLPVSSFIGRDGAVGRVAELLGRCRVVTLIGPGGVGKSRLAAHVAHAVADRYDEGIVFVELAPLREQADVASAVAAALRLTDSVAETLSERIVAVLAVRRALLVLDDCEHLAGGVAALVESITTGTSGVDVLLTSREALRADGEHVVAIRPLESAAAVALLVDRVRAADPDSDSTDTAMLAEIAARLDALPLALELAAARVPEVGVTGLLATLDEPLDALGRGRRTAADRHHSLRAVMEWSAGLLTETERELFDRLSVFGGTVDVEAVVSVCSGPDLPAAATRRALSDLVDRSLVTAQPPRRHGGDLPRYGMLETLRAFGRSRLAVRPDAAALRDRHAAWVLQVADDVARARWGPAEPELVARFDAHLAELRRAHGRLAQTGRIEELLRLSLVLAEHADQRQRVDLARLVDETLAVAGDSAHPLAARLLGLAAHPAWQRGDLATAQRRCEQAITLATSLDTPEAARDAHSAMGNIELFRGRPEVAARHSRRAAELAAAAGDRAARLIALVDLTLNQTYAGHDRAAVGHEPEITALATELGSPTALGWAAYAAGERCAERSPERAVPLLEQALEHAEAADASFLAGVVRHTLLTTAARADDPAVALPRFGPLVDHWHRSGAWTQLWIALRSLIETLSRDGRHTPAARLLGAHDSSACAAPPFGADAERLRAAAAAARAVLGDGYDAAFAEGRQLGDEGAVGEALRACEWRYEP
ncbi:MAG: AAA family ATPase [Pseudonocardiaceae bacterium]|nr:AAA family ATPase [Pseudonocardiaceae bacterium]